MSDNNVAGCVGKPDSPVCIHTRQIIDSCLDKDCIEDLRVRLTASSQEALQHASGAKARCAELLLIDVTTEPLQYKQGYFSVDLVFYYRILADATYCGTRPVTITGCATFSKRVILWGGVSRSKVFAGGASDSPVLLHPDYPLAVAEALDPMILASKIVSCPCPAMADIPQPVRAVFGEEFAEGSQAPCLYVTIGQFSTVRLERDTQLGVPSCGYCPPSRECCGEDCCEEDPCDLFSKLDFPMDAFFPQGREGDCSG